MAKILVTGGAGFIGSHIAQRLILEGHEIIVIDNFDSYYPTAIKKRNLEEMKKVGKFTFMKESLEDYNSIKKIVDEERVEIVFHEAARPGVRISVDDPLRTHEQNVTPTLNLLWISVESEIELFVNASSSSVYGEPSYLPLDETHPTRPISPYGISKLAAEHYTHCFFKIYGLPTVSLRYFTVYGPRMRPDLAIFSFTKMLFDDKQPVVFGDGEQKRDFTYVDDVVEANLKVLERKPKGAVMNIGFGENISINDLLKLLIKITGKNVQPTYKEKVKGDVSSTWANIDKAKRVLNWQPKTNIETGLKNFLRWYKEYEHSP